MSIRFAALNAALTLAQLYAPNWSDPKSERLFDLRHEGFYALGTLKQALGIAQLYPEYDADLTPIGLLETIAESLARDPDTALLAGALIRAVGQHRAERLVPEMLAQAAEIDRRSTRSAE